MTITKTCGIIPSKSRTSLFFEGGLAIIFNKTSIYLSLVVLVGALFIANILWRYFQLSKNARKPKLLNFSLFSLVFVLMMSLTIYNYADVSEVIKSVLTAKQIDYVRMIGAYLTNGGTVLLFLETFASQVVVVLSTIGVLCGIAVVTTLFYIYKQFKTIKPKIRYNKKSFFNYFYINFSFLVRSNQ